MFYFSVFENKERIKPTKEQEKKVRDFEVEANKSAWVGFNPSSGTTFSNGSFFFDFFHFLGSTGKPKLQIHRNSIFATGPKPSLAGAVGMIGFCNFVGVLKKAATNQITAGQESFQPIRNFRSRVIYYKL